MSKDKKKKDSSRRDFLKSGLTISAGAILGTGLMATVNKVKAETSGKKVKVLTTDGKVLEINESLLSEENEHEHCEYVTGSEARKGIPYRKFVLVVDLGKCNNARKCITSCQKAHNLRPEQEWLKVYKMQETKESAPYWFPKTCYHCDKAPCVSVCPVSASFKRSDGLVLIDSDSCIGCKYCMVACPYETRVFNYKKPLVENDQEYSPETSLPLKEGTVGKCDYCPDMIRKGELPHCITACPNGALYFGDVNEDVVTNGDETVRLKELLKDKAGYRYMEYFGTEPNAYYLPPYNRLFPFKEENEKES